MIPTVQIASQNSTAMFDLLIPIKNVAATQQESIDANHRMIQDLRHVSNASYQFILGNINTINGRAANVNESLKTVHVHQYNQNQSIVALKEKQQQLRMEFDELKQAYKKEESQHLDSFKSEMENNFKVMQKELDDTRRKNKRLAKILSTFGQNIMTDIGSDDDDDGKDEDKKNHDNNNNIDEKVENEVVHDIQRDIQHNNNQDDDPEATDVDSDSDGGDGDGDEKNEEQVHIVTVNPSSSVMGHGLRATSPKKHRMDICSAADPNSNASNASNACSATPPSKHPRKKGKTVPADKDRCTRNTKKGERCKLPRVVGLDICTVHRNMDIIHKETQAAHILKNLSSDPLLSSPLQLSSPVVQPPTNQPPTNHNPFHPAQE